MEQGGAEITQSRALLKIKKGEFFILGEFLG